MSERRCGSRVITSTSSIPRSTPTGAPSTSSARGFMSNSESRRDVALPATRVRSITAIVLALAVVSAWPSRAEAQQQPRGFAVERFYPSAAGGGWFVMDDLNIDGGFGGAVALITSYSKNPLEITSR